MSSPLPHDDASDRAVVSQLTRVIRRVKSSMNYRGSYTTRDILSTLVARWVNSGEWSRLKRLPDGQRHLSESVRRFVLDRLQELRRRGARDLRPDVLLDLPDDHELATWIERAELQRWMAHRIDDLCRGDVDPRVRVPLTCAEETGTALRLHIEGLSQRAIAARFGISLAVVNKRLSDGVRYLVVLRMIEEAGA